MKIYDARAVYFKSLSSLSQIVKKSIMQNRCGKNLDLSDYGEENERTDCLKLIGRTM